MHLSLLLRLVLRVVSQPVVFSEKEIEAGKTSLSTDCTSRPDDEEHLRFEAS